MKQNVSTEFLGYSFNDVHIKNGPQTPQTPKLDFPWIFLDFTRTLFSWGRPSPPTPPPRGGPRAPAGLPLMIDEFMNYLITYFTYYVLSILQEN